MTDSLTRGSMMAARTQSSTLGEGVMIRIPKSAELVANAIRSMITGGELKEGDTLPPEAQIIEEFAVSRPTVREAFRILESERLISVSRGWRGGARVHVPKAEQLARYAGFVLQTEKVTYRDVYEARSIFEPPAARFVAEHAADEAPQILRNAIADARSARQMGSAGRALATFHTRLMECTGNQTLILISRMLDGLIARFQAELSGTAPDSSTRARRSFEAGLKSQEKLVSFIAAGDGEAAEAHWRAHTVNASRVWLAGGPADSVVSWGE